MSPDDTRHKIENITKGILIQGVVDTCTSFRNLLSSRYTTSTTVKTGFEGQSIIKEEQAELIEEYCRQNNLWVGLAQKDLYMVIGLNTFSDFFKDFPDELSRINSALHEIKIIGDRYHGALQARDGK